VKGLAGFVHEAHDCATNGIHKTHVCLNMVQVFGPLLLNILYTSSPYVRSEKKVITRFKLKICSRVRTVLGVLQKNIARKHWIMNFVIKKAFVPQK